MKKTVLVLLACGFEEIEAVTCIDTLRRAGLSVTTVCVGKEKSVKGAHAIEIKADAHIEDIKELPQAVILPGGMPGAENLADSGEVMKLIKECHKEKRLIGAICASPAVVLAKAGVLEGRKATCYPGFEEKFGADTQCLNEEVVVDENIVTSRGPGTAFSFALKIAQLLQGSQMYEMIKRSALVK